MKKNVQILILMFIATLILNGCASENKSNVEEIQPPKTMQLSNDYLGIYHGIQESYFMKNQYGDEMIIAGKKVPVPASDFKFLLKEKNVVSLQQTNLKDNQRYYYNGSYKIVSNESDLIKLEISVSDGQGSSLTYILEINKTDKKGNCIASIFEPAFNISKTK